MKWAMWMKTTYYACDDGAYDVASISFRSFYRHILIWEWQRLEQCCLD